MGARIAFDVRALGVLAGCVAASLAAAAAARLAAGSVSPLDVVRWPAGVARDDMVETRYRTVRAPEGRWALVVDGSAVDRAFDSGALGMPATKQVFAGGMASNVAHLVAWTLRTLPRERRPAVVVWGVLPACLGDRREVRDAVVSDMAVARPEPRLRNAMVGADARFERESWERRLHELDPWLGVRETVADAAAVPLRALLFGGDGLPPEPAWTWRAWEEDPRHRDRQRRFMIQQWTARGALDDDPFTPDQRAACDALVALCRAEGVPLHVVHLPEHSELRAATSPAGRAKVRAFFAEREVPSLDLHDRIQDELFHDAAHLEPPGRALASSLLAAHLAATVR